MSDHIIPHFQNDAGHNAIEIGVKEFMCVGANPPFDHPHVFLDMGDESEVVCPYCSTLYRYNAKLHADETVPSGCTYDAPADKAA
ncbi:MULTISPECIES: zinc-finger domain-containing protein [Brucella/Ochrobactrum group]|uniref:Zinc-finger domain-containing protein n=2 Tax=Ochrobactrum TaxID=528 RepID=A0ABD5JWK2_9HYPH|nr:MULTISPECIES: zinc-finger domain-containing protein [Brucella]MBM7330662.1 zinc-finger domain-containing protein [Agrobacterium sp. S2]MCI1000913.1 zinc-finger domain-containing protein [Ochrobactrum sp. C6C9]MDX4073137.1 zinc-finger domain-containing protein [Brucella sp. NBRC 113783]TNV16196.1 zinc-finger domain-containing protein [[Ochrobactrum] teleogrylli]SPL64987.1 FIG00450516: Zinc-finger domain protein [[Ochrobactrum] soli]